LKHIVFHSEIRTKIQKIGLVLRISKLINLTSIWLLSEKSTLQFAKKSDVKSGQPEAFKKTQNIVFNSGKFHDSAKKLVSEYERGFNKLCQNMEMYAKGISFNKVCSNT
jgi:hypothetical protein